MFSVTLNWKELRYLAGGAPVENRAAIHSREEIVFEVAAVEKKGKASCLHCTFHIKGHSKVPLRKMFERSSQ